MFHDFIFLEKRVPPLHRWTRKDRNWRQGLFLFVVTAVVVIFFFRVLFSIAIFWTTNILLFFFFVFSPFLRLFYLVLSQSTPWFFYHVFLFISFRKFVDFQIASAFAFSCSRTYYFTHRTSIILWQLKKLCGCLSEYSLLPLIWHSIPRGDPCPIFFALLEFTTVVFRTQIVNQPLVDSIGEIRWLFRNVTCTFLLRTFTHFYSLLLDLYIFHTFSIYKPALQL